MSEDEVEGAAGEGTTPDAGGSAPPDHVPPSTRRPNVTILLAFLGVFLLLLVVFREVLFPFLMAMFVAYLVEPVVQWVTRSRLFGIRWTRGPTIVLIYVVVVGGAVWGALAGLTAAASYVRSATQSIASAAKEEARRVAFEVDAELKDELPITIPKGAIYEAASGARLRTLHDVTIESVGRRVAALAEPESGEVGHTRPGESMSHGGGEVPEDGSGKDHAQHTRIRSEVGRPATGLELRTEEQLITPIVDNLGTLGIDLEPTVVREFISHKAGVWRETLPEKVGAGAVKFAGQIALSVYQFFLILMLTAFIVTDRNGIAQFFLNVTPEPYRPAYRRLMSYIDDGLAGVIRGQIVICAVNGLLTWIGLVLLGVKGALMLSVIAAVLSLIPIFGTIVSSIPIVLIAATDGIDKGALALAWIAFIHIIEANIFNPMIMGSHAKMHPVVIVFALLAGEHTFGVWGALLAVPTMSLIQSCFRFYLHEIEGLPKAEDEGHGASLKRLWAWVRGKFGGAKGETA